MVRGIQLNICFGLRGKTGLSQEIGSLGFIPLITKTISPSILVTLGSGKSWAIHIQEALSPFIKNPSVNIRLLNFRISVLGEVARPGTFTVLEERISIPQALGLAGDLTINGDRNHVLLIRNQDGQTVNQLIDLTKSEFLHSDFYFLKQNDIIYVRPNNARVKSSGLVGNASTLVSILSLAVSLFIVCLLYTSPSPRD